MTIDEAIENLEYSTKQLEMEIESGIWIKGSVSESRCKHCDFHRQLYIYNTPTDYHICRLKGTEPINPQGYCEKYKPKTEEEE